MKYLLTLILAFSYSASFSQSASQDSIYLDQAEKEAKVMAKLLIEKDYKKFAKYTYRPLVEMMGGEDKMAELIENAMEQIETKGFSIISCTVERPTSIIHINKELQCTLMQMIEMKIPNGRMTTRSTLIGISSNNGESWTFVDTQRKPIETLRETMPDLSDKLVIPEKEKPVMHEN